MELYRILESQQCKLPFVKYVRKCSKRISSNMRMSKIITKQYLWYNLRCTSAKLRLLSGLAQPFKNIAKSNCKQQVMNLLSLLHCIRRRNSQVTRKTSLEPWMFTNLTNSHSLHWISNKHPRNQIPC